MTNYMHSKPIFERAQLAKTRQCLKCREKFTSSWSGERICGKCKGLKKK